jgi:hypothetical protein
MLACSLAQMLAVYLAACAGVVVLIAWLTRHWN